MLFIQQLSTSHEVVLAYFGNVHGLANFDGYGPLVWSPSDSEAARALSPQLIFGAFGSRGKLKADVGEVFVAGAGDTTQPLHRLKYTMPQELGIRSEEHTSELQSLMRITYAVFCMTKKNNIKQSQAQQNISKTHQ